MPRKTINLRLFGATELIKTFDTLTFKIQKKALRSGLRAGAKVFQKQVIKNLPPDDSGLLRQSLKGAKAIVPLKRSRVRFGLKLRTGTRQMLQIPRHKKGDKGKGPGYYPAHVEYGTRKNNIRPRRYMRRAFISKMVRAQEAMAKKIAQRIEQILRREKTKKVKK